MTTTLKSAPLAWLITLHYLGAVLGAAVVLFVLLAATGFVLPELIVWAGTQIGQIALAVLYLAVLWATTLLTVKFLKGRYLIADPAKLLRWSSGVFVIVQVLIWLWAFFSIGAIPGLMDLISTLVALAVFYGSSRTYLR